jgi:PKD repeat protein
VTLTVQPSGNTKVRDVGILPIGNTDNLLAPDFTWTPTNPNIGDPVTFTDLTTPADSVGQWTWAFGDGTTSNLHAPPPHTYSTTGMITVALTVVNNHTGGGGVFITHVLNVGTVPTNSPTPTQTRTATQTPTITATVPPTQTTTPPPGSTATPTATVTATPGGPTGTPTVTGTPPTGTPVNTSTRTRTRTPTPVLGPQIVAGYLAVAGSTPGNFGSFFKTAVQLTNPGPGASAGRFFYHEAGLNPANGTLSWSLAPGQTIGYDDIVAAMGQNGLGTIDLYVAQGSPVPIVLTRIYDDGGASGTSGFTEPFYRTLDVPQNGGGYLIGPSDVSRYRYNLGFRTLSSDVHVTATVRNSNGAVVHGQHDLPPNFFIRIRRAVSGVQPRQQPVDRITYSGGGLIAYGATVDNVTNDRRAVLQLHASTQTADAAPRTRGAVAAALFAAVLAALGLGVGAVVAKR